MTTTEQLHAYRDRTESLRKMAETRDCVIAALESMLATALKAEDNAWESAICRNPRAMLNHSRNERIVAAKAALVIE